MTGKLARIFGLVGGGLTLLPNLISMALYTYTLTLPDEGLHFEAKGYASGFMVMTILPCILSATGFISGFFVRRKPLLTGVLMITCGFLMTVVMPISYVSIEEMIYENGIIINADIALCLIRIPPLMLTAAGVLSIVHRESVLCRKENSAEPIIDNNTIN